MIIFRHAMRARGDDTDVLSAAARCRRDDAAARDVPRHFSPIRASEDDARRVQDACQERLPAASVMR